MPATPNDRKTPTTLGELSESVNRRFDADDRRFDGVEAAIVEQRQCTEFASGQLKQDLGVVKSTVGRLERKIDRLIDREPPTGKSEPDAPQ